MYYGFVCVPAMAAVVPVPASAVSTQNYDINPRHFEAARPAAWELEALASTPPRLPATYLQLWAALAVASLSPAFADRSRREARRRDSFGALALRLTQPACWPRLPVAETSRAEAIALAQPWRPSRGSRT